MIVVRVLLGLLAACGLLLVACWTRAIRSDPALQREGRIKAPTPLSLVIGFVTNFLDTLGIGSFATTTAIIRLLGLVPDELIPGTLMVGLALPVVTQAFIFISVVRVDPTQMACLIAVSIVGGWLGAGVVASLSRRAVQIGMGCALLAAAAFMVVSMSGLFPGGGTALSFTRAAFIAAVAINFGLGALLTLGIGNYGPSLVAFSLLGIDPRAAFPVMMGSGAFPRAHGARVDDWRDSRCDRCGMARGVAAAGRPPLARADRRDVRRGDAVESGPPAVNKLFPNTR
jgi:hypothetical protein